MTEHAIRQVEFRGMRLWARVGDAPSATFIAVPPICRHLGLAENKQRRRIQDHPVLAERSDLFVLPSGRGEQPTLCIRLDALNLWLAMIQPHKGRDPELQKRLVMYQRECADVLYQHFFGAVPLPTDVIERHDMTEVKRDLRLVVDNTRSLVEKVETLSGQVTAQGWQNADIKQTVDEGIQVLVQGQGDLKAGIDQVNSDMADVKRDARTMASAVEAVRKHPQRSERRFNDTGRKYADALRKLKQQDLDFGGCA